MDNSKDGIAQKYAIHKSVRLQHFDYSQPGEYFVTICAFQRKSYFGNISGGIMHLSPIGEIVLVCWTEIKNHFANIELPAYSVMPNHFHGIILINEPVEARHAVPGDLSCSNQTTIRASESFGKPVSSSLPTIIRSYKSAVTRRANADFRSASSINVWQRGYYEHVIRNEEELAQIGDYILCNLSRWEEDRENLDLKIRVKPKPFEY